MDATTTRRTVYSLLTIFVSFARSVPDKPNVLLIVVDDLRPALGIYGDPNAYTPNIDGLARKSVVFTHAYAQQALCAPSRNSFLTSRRPDTLRLYDFYNYWRDTVGNFTTLPQYFKQAGYETYSVGKVFHPGRSSNDTDDFPYSWSRRPFHPNTEKYKQSRVCPDKHGHRRNLVCPVSLRFQPEQTLPDIESVDEATLFLNERRNEVDQKPFFLAVGFHKPHIPLKYPREYLKFHPLENVTIAKNRFRPPKLPTVAWNPWTDVRDREDIMDLNVTFPFGSMPDRWIRSITQSYGAAVTYVDGLIGWLLNEIDQSNTVVVLIGDHGWSLGEHGEWSKFSNFDVSTRVPFIIRVPDAVATSAPHFVETPVELVDLFPTLVDVALSKPIPRCDRTSSSELCTEGKSLVPTFDSERGARDDDEYAAFSQYPRPGIFPTARPNSDKPKLRDIRIMGYSMKYTTYRYTEWVGFNGTTYDVDWSSVYGVEMYNHEFDDGEDTNLAGLPGLEAVQEELRSRLRSGWQQNRF